MILPLVYDKPGTVIVHRPCDTIGKMSSLTNAAVCAAVRHHPVVARWHDPSIEIGRTLYVGPMDVRAIYGTLPHGRSHTHFVIAMCILSLPGCQLALAWPQDG
ncbi:hypothetical protein Vafri_19088 [Volvox africanus]|uniref:Uncharacterized protein n=1 Tax=Volvox africanus TaxID=51714 RepID=A0A8J4BTU5_9CHLO|nr:hypothetical protein Vafri_19088 [Volvox africanus]